MLNLNYQMKNWWREVFQFCLWNSSGTFPETKLKNWKTEKLFFMENLSLDVSGKNSFSVFQFCLRKYSGTFPETKLKNWKAVFLWRISPWMSLETVFQFFSFSVLLTELFRNISGDKTKKLKNCFFMENLSLDVSGKNSFSVFQFCLRKYSGTFPETKLKNWKTVFLWRISPWISLEKTVFQFFSFSVLLTELFRNISGDKTKKLKNCFFMENLSLDVSGKNSFSVFQFCLRKYSGTYHIF